MRATLLFRVSLHALLLGVLLGSLPASGAALSSAVLGNTGELYELVPGTYGELFGDGLEAAEDDPVLALDITHPDRRQERLLVPGTSGPRLESPAVLLHDRQTDNLLVLWQSDELGEGTLLRLTTLRGGQFFDVVEIEDPTLAELRRTQVVLTHDRYQVELENGDKELVSRTILHLAWTASEHGETDVRYTPLIFLNGGYIGWHEVFSLRDLLVGEPLDRPAGMHPDLENALRLETTRDNQRVLAAFANAQTGELSVLDIGVMPLELAMLSDLVREVLGGLEGDFDPRDLVGFAEGARLEIIGTGFRRKLHTELVDYIAVEVGKEIVAVGADLASRGYDVLTEHLRQFVVSLTTPLVTTDISFVPGVGDSQVVEIDVGGLFGEGAIPSQILDLHVVRSVPLPRTGEGMTTIYTSHNGQDLLVVWEDAQRGRYDYVEWLAGAEAWSERHRLRLDDPLRAHQVLRLRVR